MIEAKKKRSKTPEEQVLYLLRFVGVNEAIKAARNVLERCKTDKAHLHWLRVIVQLMNLQVRNEVS